VPSWTTTTPADPIESEYVPASCSSSGAPLGFQIVDRRPGGGRDVGRLGARVRGAARDEAQEEKGGEGGADYPHSTTTGSVMIG
jgi:hypothetical protein